MRPSGKRSLHHCSFRSEENQRTEDKLITLMKKVCCQLSLLSQTSTERPVHEPSSCREKPSREMENETIRILLERQKKSKFSLNLDPRFRNMNFKPIREFRYRRRSFTIVFFVTAACCSSPSPTSRVFCVVPDRPCRVVGDAAHTSAFVSAPWTPPRRSP